MPERKKRLNYKRLILLIIYLLVLIAGGSIFGYVAYAFYDLPAWDESRLTSGGTTLIYDREGNLVSRIGAENRINVALKNIPPHVRYAFIAAEDARFYEHFGIDLRGILRAVWSNLIGHGIYQGGSTITQQVVKMSFLTPERTFKRKLQEAILALKLERHYSKDEILEMYLNRIYLGEGAYGVQAAASVYFNKSVDQLTLSEAATLAGITSAPSKYSPYRNMEAALKMRNSVLDSMARYEFITQAQADRAKNEKIVLAGTKPSLYPYAYFIDYITEELVERYGEEMTFRGGLRVYTTLDRKIQEIAERAVADPTNFPTSRRDNKNELQPQGAVVVLDPQSGHILALVGGREHKYQRGFNRAVASKRQPGSAIKPILVYAPAIELKNMGPATVIDDSPVTYAQYNNYTPRNYDNTYHGLVTMRQAVIHSLNVPAVRTLMEEVGISNAVAFAARLGIKLNPADRGPSIALGGLTEGVTPLQMAAAYAAFANLGAYIEPTAILKIEASDGRVLEEVRPQRYQAMKPTTAYLITDMLKSVINEGTGRSAQLGRPAAGKTGTTESYNDAWFVGYTPQLVCAVWMGNDEKEPMKGVTGGSYPARLWKTIMIRALEGKPAEDFPRPAGIVSATVDSKSGLLPGPYTPSEQQVTDLFVEGTEPKQVDDNRVAVEICPVSGQLAGPNCPQRVIRMVIKKPAAGNVADADQRIPNTICPIHNPPASGSTGSSASNGVSPQENNNTAPVSSHGIGRGSNKSNGSKDNKDNRQEKNRQQE